MSGELFPWVRVRYGPGTIEVAMLGCSVVGRSLHTGAPCALDRIQDGMIIEDNRRSVCMQVAAAIIEENTDAVRWELCQPDTHEIDYTHRQLQGKAAVILLLAARAAIGSDSHTLADLEHTTWADLVRMIPGEEPYEP